MAFLTFTKQAELLRSNILINLLGFNKKQKSVKLKRGFKMILIAIKEKNREKAYKNCRKCFFNDRNNCRKPKRLPKCIPTEKRDYYLCFKINVERF